MNGIPEGEGIMYWNNDNRYEGEFKNNKMEGKGIIQWKDDYRYIGEWKNGKKDGKGILYFQNGSILSIYIDGDNIPPLIINGLLIVSKAFSHKDDDIILECSGNFMDVSILPSG